MLHFTKYQLSSEAPWVTFIHGAGGSSSIWYKQVRDFSAHFNVLLIDLRGHGESKNSLYSKLKQYTFDSISDEVIEVLDHNAIKTSHFIGISLGTIIIREIAERFPERTQSMILAGAVMKLNLRGQILMRLGVVFKSVLPYLLIYKFFAFIIMPRKSNQESRILFLKEAKKLYQKEFIRWFSLVAEVNPLLSLFRIKDCGIPTLYLMGQQDYMFLPSIKALSKNHVSSTLCVVPDCGHVVNVEQPVVFNTLAINFLQGKN
jgi:pimeloyl-ACP methyl ester carboxylesterase